MPALSLLTKSATYTNGNPNDADEVELDLANAYANFASIQTDYNNLVTGAYTIAGVKTFSSTPKMDAIAEVTSGNGVVVDSLKLKDGTVIFPTATELTIASGAITVTQGLHTVDTEGDAATDNLDTINGLAAGQIVVLRAANGARDVVLTNGVGNVYTPNGTSATLSSTTQGLLVVGDGTNAIVLGAPAPSGKTVYTGSNAAEAEITFGTASTYRISGWIRVLTDARNIAVQFSDGTYKTASYRYSATGRNDSGTGTGGASTSAAAILINGDNTIGNASGEYLGVDITVTAKGSTDAIYSGLRGSITTVNTSGVNITNNVSGIYTGTLADMTKMKFFSETGGSANGNITYNLTVEEMA